MPHAIDPLALRVADRIPAVQAVRASGTCNADDLLALDDSMPGFPGDLATAIGWTVAGAFLSADLGQVGVEQLDAALAFRAARVGVGMGVISRP